MRRYVTRKPRAQWCEEDIEIWPHEQVSVTVFEDERSPAPTGILDKRGNELMAVEDPNPCGFVAFNKESL